MKNLIISLMIFVFTAGLVFTQPRREEGKLKHRNLMESLKLTDAQKEKFESLRSNHQKEMIDLKAQLEKDELALRELKSKKNFSRSEYLDAVKKINEIENKISLSRANHRMDVYEMLTDEQKKEFIQFGPNFHMRESGRDFHNRRHSTDCPFN